MSRFLSGLILILFVLVTNVIVAFIGSDQASASAAPPGCSTNNNFTTCQDVSKTSFLAALFGTVVGGLTGVPMIVGLLYSLIMDFLLVGGIILVVIAIAPFLNN